MEEKFEIFALISLFGHKRLAGKVTLMNMGNVSMLRVDIPETKSIPAFTRFINPSAIYSMDPITEELMKTMAEGFKEQPIDVYDIREIMKRMKPSLPDPDEPKELEDEDNARNF